jgi:nitrogen fixation NifU-like protein
MLERYSERDEEEDSELFADHVSHPRGTAPISEPAVTRTNTRPVCGDAVEVSIALEETPQGLEGEVQNTSHQKLALQVLAHGCAVNRASASLMADLMSGLSFDECCDRLAAFRAMMQGDPSQGVSLTNGAVDAGLLGDTVMLQSMRRYPSRVPCIMLAWDAFANCIRALSEKCSSEQLEGEGRS